MAFATLQSVSDAFPTGTTVGAYLAKYRRNDGSPIGSSVAEGVVSDAGSVAFYDLDHDTEYVAYASVGGQHRYRNFSTYRTVAQHVGLVGSPSGGDRMAYDAAREAWVTSADTVALYEAFAGKSDAALVTADTGQAWTHNTTSSTSDYTEAKLRIVSQRLQQALTGAQRGNGYAQVELDGNVARIGCRFRFDGVSLSGSNLVVLAIWDRPIIRDHPQGIPNSPCHLTITPAKWTYGYWDDTGGLELVDIMNGYWDDALVSGTEYEIEVFLDLTASSVTIKTSVPCSSPLDQVENATALETADGLVHSITDAEIAEHAGQWACFELTQAADPASTYQPSMTEVWADVA